MVNLNVFSILLMLRMAVGQLGTDGVEIYSYQSEDIIFSVDESFGVDMTQLETFGIQLNLKDFPFFRVEGGAIQTPTTYNFDAIANITLIPGADVYNVGIDGASLDGLGRSVVPDSQCPFKDLSGRCPFKVPYAIFKLANKQVMLRSSLFIYIEAVAFKGSFNDFSLGLSRVNLKQCEFNFDEETQLFSVDYGKLTEPFAHVKADGRGIFDFPIYLELDNGTASFDLSEKVEVVVGHPTFSTVITKITGDECEDDSLFCRKFSILAIPEVTTELLSKIALRFDEKNNITLRMNQRPELSTALNTSMIIREDLECENPPGNSPDSKSDDNNNSGKFLGAIFSVIGLLVVVFSVYIYKKSKGAKPEDTHISHYQIPDSEKQNMKETTL